MEFSTFVVVVFYFFVVVINLCSFFAVLLVGLIVQIINYLQLKWFVTKLTVTYMFKRVIFSRFTPKYVITIWLGLWGIIPVRTIIFNIWRRCLSWFGQYRNAAVIIITFVLFLQLTSSWSSSSSFLSSMGEELVASPLSLPSKPAR